jgi:hypothetical protein
MENEIRRLEDKIASLENEFHSRMNKLENGEKDTLYCKKIVISPEVEYDSPLIINYPDGSKCMAFEFSEETGKGHIIFYNGENNVVHIGVCEHGGGRIQLNNIDGENMAYIGGRSNSDNHEPMIDITHRDTDSGWHARLDSGEGLVGFYDREDPFWTK